MPVTSSSYALDDHAQPDGSLWCRETHVAPSGNVEFYYLGAPGFDPQGIMAGRVALVNAQLADAETSANIDNDAAPVAVEQPITTFLLAYRARYKASDRADTCKMAWWLLRRIAGGQITDAQCQTAFSVTATQWTNFKTNKLTPQSNAWAGVVAATGS